MGLTLLPSSKSRWKLKKPGETFLAAKLITPRGPRGHNGLRKRPYSSARPEEIVEKESRVETSVLAVLPTERLFLDHLFAVLHLDAKKIKQGGGKWVSIIAVILWKLELWKSQSSLPMVKVKPTQRKEFSPGLSLPQGTCLYFGLKSWAFFLSVRIQKTAGKTYLFFLLVKCLFLFHRSRIELCFTLPI